MKYLFIHLDFEKENSKPISFHYVQTDTDFNIEKGNIVELNTKRNIQKVINKLTRKGNKVIGYSKENIIPLISLCKKKEIEFDNPPTHTFLLI